MTTLPIAYARDGITASVVDYLECRAVIHGIREAVFVYEQSIPARFELDEYDPISHHVLASWQENPIGTGRLTPEGRIGRVAVSREFRRQGAGRRIIETLLESAKQQHLQQVMLAAQSHAVPFYEQFGFCREGYWFEELGIQHVMMRKPLA